MGQTDTGKIEHKSLAWEVKSLDDSGGFTLYAAVFGNVDRQGDEIRPGAVRGLDTLVKDGWSAVNHQNGSLPVGYIVSAAQDARGLLVSGVFHSTPSAQECRTVVRERKEAGKSVKCSIGYRVIDAATEVRDGERIRILKAIEVFEVSFVNLPANPEAEVVAAKSAAEPTGERMSEPANDAGGLIQALKELLGLSKKAIDKGKMSPSGMTRLKSFAEAMHEHGTATREHAKAMAEHGKTACSLAKEMKGFLKEYDADPDADPGDDDVDGDEPEPEEQERPKKPKGKSAPQTTLQIYRDQLGRRAASGRSQESCP